MGERLKGKKKKAGEWLKEWLREKNGHNANSIPLPVFFVECSYLSLLLFVFCGCFPKAEGKERERERKRETGERNSGLDDTSIHYTDSLIPLVMPIPFLSYLSLLLFVSVVFIRKTERERKERERRERKRERATKKLNNVWCLFRRLLSQCQFHSPRVFFLTRGCCYSFSVRKRREREREWEKKRVEKKLSRADPICIIIRFPSS